MTWDISNVGAVADDLGEVYGVSLAAVGLLTTALFVTHLAVQIPGGRLIDRVGARSVGLAALAIVAAANAIALTAPSLGVGLGARLLMGFGTGAGFVAGLDLVRAGRGGPFWQGAYGGSTMAAGGLALMVVPQLVPALGWRAPYWTGLALAVAGTVPVLAAGRAAGDGHEEADGTPRVSVFRDRGLWPLAAVQMATFGLSVVAGNWVVTLLERQDHGRSASAVIGGLVLFAGVLTRPGRRARRAARTLARLAARGAEPRPRLGRRARARRGTAALGRSRRCTARRPRRRLPVRLRLRHDRSPSPRRSRCGGRLRQRLGGPRHPRLHPARGPHVRAAGGRQDRLRRNRAPLGIGARGRAGGPAELTAQSAAAPRTAVTRAS